MEVIFTIPWMTGMAILGHLCGLWGLICLDDCRAFCMTAGKRFNCRSVLLRWSNIRCPESNSHSIMIGFGVSFSYFLFHSLKNAFHTYNLHFQQFTVRGNFTFTPSRPQSRRAVCGAETRLFGLF